MTTTLLIILGINVVYVSLFTLRVNLVIRGYPVVASILSMAEVFIYLMGLTLVFDNLDKPVNIIAYCVGWGMGVFLGSKIERFLALGYIVFEVVSNVVDFDIPSEIRKKGYGVTSWLADGKDGKRLVMKVVAKRKSEENLRKHILSLIPKAFIISYEPNQFNGGFFVKHIR